MEFIVNNDVLMVDKGFLIEKELVFLDLQLNILFFVFSVRLFSESDVNFIRKIVIYRIYIECVIN